MRWLLTLMTERDNKSPCIVRVMWILVFAHLMLLTAYALYKGQPLDFGASVRGWCEYLGFASIGIAGKALTEKRE